ncbi:MAG TPA: POTRA domain-containing protein [Pyrinomonadaceae bacterium]|nr:POTRA domain-containing protein [Pyrinomonadaceae bacterium]
MTEIPTRIRRKAEHCALAALICCALFAAAAHGQASRWENRPIAEVLVVFEGADPNISSAEQFRMIARAALGSTYSTVNIRNAIADIYDTGQVAMVTVEAIDAPGNSVQLRFLIRRQTIARRVSIEVVEAEDVDVSEQELLLRLNLLDPGTVVNERVLQTNADMILEYLRERGFYRAEAVYEQRPMAAGTDVAVVFRVTTGTQATVEAFNIDIEGFDNAALQREIKLKAGEPYSRAELQRDVDRIRETLRESDFLAPTLNEPRTVYDSSTNTIAISLTGSAGPTVEVVVDAEGGAGVGSSTQNRLLPIRRDGTLDYAAIIEGERRLENHYQERGYFFVDVIAVCSVEPAVTERDGAVLPSGTEYLCSVLTSSDLQGRNVEVKYVVNLDRRLRLEEMRLEGTDQFTIDEIKPVLDTQEANILGIIPIFGYGRGYTSQRILENDAATIRSLLRELGYRDAEVRVNQGVSLTGDELIITFVVDQGEPTVVSNVRIVGNTAFTDAELEAVLPEIVGRNYSRARARNGQRRISEYYAERGYFDAKIDFAAEEEPVDPATGEPRFEVIYTVENEGVPVYINRILVTGNERTKTGAIEKALTLESDTLLRATDIYTSEQNLYASAAFERVNITTQPVGDRAGGGRLTDVIVEVIEQPPRLLQYGGGFSTDLGLTGFVDIRHFNLLGNLWQGGARLRWSQRQQLIQLDFVNPRFLKDGEKRYAPLTVSAQYQRDSTVTRFFRSAFDQGTFGIVQRIDEEGNPIDEFGEPAGDPTLNRLTLTAESNRTISRRDRSILFFRYRFEDVRLTNIRSLLIRDLLEPDSRIRISGFGATFVRDTRERCNIEYSVLEIIARGDPGDPCRYNVSDPTNGNYFTAEYNVSLPALGANIGFHKFQASYNFYYTLTGLRNTTLAARGILGLASVFSKRERFASEQFPELEGILPISERFFAGGSNTLRGFKFESAGPRVVIVPEGEFINRDGEPVFLDPFTIPFGGNGLAVVNLEARVPLNNWIRAVPFYDGGNVFRRVGDIFNPPDVPEDDVFRRNLRALWTHSVGLGFRFKTPIGGEFGIDYGYLLNPPTFIIPQGNNPAAFYRLPQGHLHFRFSQAF